MKVFGQPARSWTSEEDAALLAGLRAGETFPQIRDRRLPERSVASVGARGYALRSRAAPHDLPPANAAPPPPSGEGAVLGAEDGVVRADLAGRNRRLLIAMLSWGANKLPPNGLPSLSYGQFSDLCRAHGVRQESARDPAQDASVRRGGFRSGRPGASSCIDEGLHP